MRVQTLVTAACLAFLAPLNASQLDLAFLTPPNTSPRDMTALGRKYLNGDGVKQSDGEALRWFQAAATKGESNAHYLIGWMHEVGRAAQKSLPVASEWYLKAAKLGDADGMNATGRALENGWAGTKDLVAAFDWYTTAAAHGQRDGMDNAGYFELNGIAGPRRPALALSYFLSSAKLGSTWGIDRLVALIVQKKLDAKVTDSSIDWIRAEATAGNSMAMSAFGSLLQNGAGVEKNIAKARIHFEKASNLNEASAHWKLGVAFENGFGGEKSATRAFALYGKSAALDYAEGVNALGRAYFNGIGTARNQVEGIKLYQRAAAAGLDSAKLNLGDALKTGKGIHADVQRAKALYEEVANGGNVVGMRALGILLCEDSRTKQDGEKAVQWLQRAIEGDDLPALKTLGIFYRDGTCMPKDLAKAASLFKRGAELGNAEAMSSLAVSYRDGQGVQRDYDLMLKWVRAAMEAGDTYAYSALAEAYHNGFGVVKSQKEAVTWWRKGVDAGCGICAAQLAKWHYSERGDNPNDNEAARLFLQAVEVDQGGRLNEEGVSNASLAQREFDRLLAEGRITDQEVLKRIRASSLPSPSATWLVPPSSTDAESIMLQVSLSDVGGGMGRVELRVNDVAVGEFSRAASDSRAASATEGAVGVRYIYHLRVAAGTHRLEVRAYNKDSFINFSTLTTSIVSSYEPPRKPRLFAVVVGIDDYENSRLKLKFAGSDARAIGDLLKTQIKNGGLYSGGDVVVLTTKADTSKARITQALSALHDGKKLRADDVFVLFVAGHGSFDSDVRRYTMFTSDVLQLSIERLAASGISSDELQALVRNIPTLKKLILLDTCNSGGAFEGEGASAYFKPKQARSGIEEQQIINTMKNRSGASLLAASSAEQEALEGYNGHGIFTWHLLEGMKGKAARGGSTLVSTDDLKTFVEDQVPITTEKVFKAKQSPFSSTLGQGFPVVANP